MALAVPSVSLPPLSFSVLGQHAAFRQNSTVDLLNPTNATPPFFQIFDESFNSLLPGNDSFIKQIASEDFRFAADAALFNPGTNELFFASATSSPINTNLFSKINLTQVEESVAADTEDINIPFISVKMPDNVQVTNGGTQFKGNFLLVTGGLQELPASVVMVNPTFNPPYALNSTVLLDNFFGRQFNSLNDVKVHQSGQIFFTDSSLGFFEGEKPAPSLPNQVYAFNPATGLVRAVADQLDEPNGIAFGNNGKIAYIGDSGADQHGPIAPATVYAYDVDPTTLTFTNRRVFAFIDAGTPDGIQVDTKGNVYIAAGDGVQVFNSSGILIGKIFTGSKVGSLTFAGNNMLFLLAEKSIFVASIKAESNLVSTS